MSSFRFLTAVRTDLRAGRNLVIRWTVGVLTMLLEILAVIVITVLMIASVLLRPKLMYLLRASSKLIWPAISSHRHFGVVSS